MIKFLRENKLQSVLIKYYGVPTGEKIKLLWREGWSHYPAFMLLGIGMTTIFSIHAFCLKFVYNPPEYPKYRYVPTVYRPDDPRVKLINNYCRLDD